MYSISDLSDKEKIQRFTYNLIYVLKSLRMIVLKYGEK